LFLDWVGRSTVYEDIEALRAKLPNWAEWAVIDTPTWVPAVLAGLMTLGLLFLMWREQPAQHRPAAPSKRSASWTKMTLRPKGNEKSIPFDSDHDFDFILRPEDTFFAEGNRSDDGVDMAVRVVVRNRSKTPLWVDIFEPGTLAVQGKESPNPGGGMSRPFRPESNQPSVFGGMRLYDGMEGKTGTGTMSYLFGQTEESARWILDVDVDFRILGDPKAKGKNERVPVEILANRSRYRPKPVEDE